MARSETRDNDSIASSMRLVCTLPLRSPEAVSVDADELECPFLNAVQNNLQIALPAATAGQIFFDISDTKSSKTLAINSIHDSSRLHLLFGTTGSAVRIDCYGIGS